MNALTRDIARRLREGADVLTIAKQPLPGMTESQTRAFVGRIADEVFNLGIDHDQGRPPPTPPISKEQNIARLAAYMAGLSDADAAKRCGISGSSFRGWRIRHKFAPNFAPRKKPA